MEKLHIGIDIDDVLIKSAERSVDMYNEAYGTSLALDDWYDFSDLSVWGDDNFPILVKRVVDIMADDAFSSVESVEGAFAVLERLKSDGHDLIAVTGRSESIRKQTKAVLDALYPSIFEDDTLHFADYYNHDGHQASKADIGLELGLTHFIDDLPAHASATARVGIKTVLFSPGYSWNQEGVDEDVRGSVLVLDTWHSIGEFLDAEAV